MLWHYNDVLHNFNQVTFTFCQVYSSTSVFVKAVLGCLGLALMEDSSFLVNKQCLVQRDMAPTVGTGPWHRGGFKLLRFIDLPDDPGQYGIPVPCACLLNEWLSTFQLNRKKETVKAKRKWPSSQIHISWVHDLHFDQFPKLLLSQGHTRGNSWHVGWWSAVTEERNKLAGLFSSEWREGSVCSNKNI